MKQHEIIGYDFEGQLRQIVQKLKINKTFIVTGNESYVSTGAEKRIKNILNDAQILRFSGFQSNPNLDDVRLGIDEINRFRPDVIIAIGGGGVIDMAKIINILSSNNDYTPNEYIKQNALIKQRGLPLVAIPTTAGTGSEATHFSVIYVGKKKYSLSSEFMLPDYAIIDPMLCYKLPKKLLASSGIDALCQAVESYWAVRSTTESKKYAEEAIKLILPSIENAVDGDNDAIRNMSIAAHLSGKAINITTTTAPHALSYPMTAYYGVKHGHAVSLTLGSFFEINYKFNDSDLKDYRGKQYLLDTMEQIFDMFGAGNYMECKKYWKNLMFKIGLETDFKKIGIKSLHDKEIIAKNINIERLRNNPVNIDESIVQKILHGDL